MKACSRCKEVKNVNAFYVSTSTGRVQNYCKPCQSSYDKARYVDDPVRIKKRNHTWREANLEKDNTTKRAWRTANPEKVRYINVKHSYGLSSEEYDAMSKKCGICGVTEGLVVDHNHSTGEVRGTLCRKHNMALGLFNDDPILLLRAADYLMGVLTEKVRCMVNERLRQRKL